MGSISHPEFAGLADQIAQLVSEIDIEEVINSKDEAARFKALRAAQKLVIRLKKPGDFASEATSQMPSQIACLCIAINLRIFHCLAERKESSLSVEELADILGIEEDFLRRTMRVIVASSYVDETDVDTYKANPYTIGLARPELESTIKYCYNHHPNVLLTAPRFFAKEGYCAPQTTHTPCHVARNTNLDQFSWMREHPRPLEEFNTWMSAQELRLPAWTEWFPVRDHLLQSNDLNQDEILLVDVAGGIGQDLKAFQGRYPDAKGRLILQDMEKVVAQAVKDGLPDGIEAMAIDLFDPQPVQGARNYSINAVLHNWSDADAVAILKRIAAAMFSAGRSLLLINDVVLPDRDASIDQASIDMTMMFVFGQAKERTERQWRALLTEAGLSVKKFWSPPSPGKGVVEAVKG